MHVTHWVKLGWDMGTLLPANADCFSQGWGDLHSCSHMAVSRLNFDSRQLVLVYFFDKALDISARQRQALCCLPHLHCQSCTCAFLSYPVKRAMQQARDD